MGLKIMNTYHSVTLLYEIIKIQFKTRSFWTGRDHVRKN